MNTLILLIIFIFVGWYSVKQVHPYEAEEEQQYQEEKGNRKKRKQNGKKNR